MSTSSSTVIGALISDVKSCDMADNDVIGFGSVVRGRLCLGTGFLRAKKKLVFVIEFFFLSFFFFKKRKINRDFLQSLQILSLSKLSSSLLRDFVHKFKGPSSQDSEEGGTNPLLDEWAGSFITST